MYSILKIRLNNDSLFLSSYHSSVNASILSSERKTHQPFIQGSGFRSGAFVTSWANGILISQIYYSPHRICCLSNVHKHTIRGSFQLCWEAVGLQVQIFPFGYQKPEGWAEADRARAHAHTCAETVLCAWAKWSPGSWMRLLSHMSIYRVLQFIEKSQYFLLLTLSIKNIIPAISFQYFQLIYSKEINSKPSDARGYLPT